MIKVVVDALGGDYSPSVNIEGTVKAINEIKDVHIVLVGDENVLNEGLKNYSYDKERLTIVHAPDVISCNDKPTEAIKTKKESSLYKSVEILKTEEDANALVSIGSTGAILASAVLKIGRIKGVKRPAFCPVFPNVVGGVVAICDSGANVDCDSLQLSQFALMGSVYLDKTFGVKNARVALLNVGVEEEKGDMLRKETHQKLKEMHEEGKINFAGNMESRDLLKGDFDLVVCDGFAGNVLLKSTEGACIELMKLIKGAFTKNLKNKLGALLLKKDIYEIKNLLDYNKQGGAVLLGASKTIVKGHGSSKGEAVFHCIEQAYNMEKGNIRDAIAEAVK